MGQLQDGDCGTLTALSIKESANMLCDPTSLLAVQFGMGEVRLKRLDHFVGVVHEPNPAGLSNGLEMRPKMIHILDQGLVGLARLGIIIEVYYRLIEESRIHGDRGGEVHHN